jgi:hypothetical protein
MVLTCILWICRFVHEQFEYFELVANVGIFCSLVESEMSANSHFALLVNPFCNWLHWWAEFTHQLF